MDSAGTSSYGRAAEALTRTFSKNPENFNVSLRSMPSLQPRSPPVYSPDTRVFDTPEQSSHLPARDEGPFTLHRGTTRPEPEHAFHEQMDQYSREQLAKEWDALFLGDGSDDVHNGADVYRQLRKDLRTLSCSLKQSFELLLEGRRYSLPGTGPSSGVQQVQACISELKSVAKEMASATRMANDNYNLQVELTLQKHASQHLLSQLHEAQLARMAMEEELNVLRNKAQQAVATEATVLHLRQLNDALQAESQQASGELQELRRRLREQEEKLEATTLQAEHLAERLREIELFEDVGGSHVLFRDLCGSSDGGASEGGFGAGVAGGIGVGATAAGAPGSQLPHHHHHYHGADHGSCGRSMAAAAAAAATAAGSGGPTGESCSVDGSSHGPGGRSQLPPELRRVLGKLLRRRDADTAKLREDSAQMAEEVARLRELLAAAAAAAAAPPPIPEGRRPAAPTTASGPTPPSSASTLGQQPTQRQQEPRSATPWRSSSDSWHTDDDFDWAIRPVTRLADLHPHSHPPPCPQNGGESPLQQTQRQQHLPHGPRQAHHRPLHPHSRQQHQHQQPYCQSRQAAAEQHDPQQDQEVASVAAELEAAREAIARLSAELAEARERVKVQQVEAMTAAEAAAATMQQRQLGLRASEAQAAQGVAALADAEQAGAQLREKLREAQAALTETETSRMKMRTAMEAARKALAEAQAVVAAQDKFLLVLLIVLQQAVAGRDTLAAELREARRLAEAKAAVDATNAHAASSDAARLVSENDRMAAELAEAGQKIASLESQLAAVTTANAELKGCLGDVEQRERKARDGLAKDLETARQRIARLQSDLREYRSEAQVARGEATAASRDVKAANSEKLKAQREMEEAVERLRQMESERDTLAAALAAAAVPDVAAPEAETQAAERGTGAGQEPAAVVELEAKMVLELEAARRELAAAEQLFAQERRVSEQEAEKLGGQLKALQSELEAVKAELAATEKRLAQSESMAAAAQEQHVSETLLLRSSLAEAQQRVKELEEQLATLRRAAGEDAVAPAAVRATSAEARSQDLLGAVEKDAELRLRQLEEQLQAAEVAQRLAEKRSGEELKALRAQLAAAAAVTTAKPFHGCSASSSDAGTSGGGSPELSKEAAAAGTAALQGPADGSIHEPDVAEDNEDDELEDLLALRARCRALRGELALARSRLAALTEVSEAAAQGRLAEAVAEVQAAAAAGRVKNDEEFWAHNDKMHSLHALVTALRATCLYAGPAGAHATYGDTRADGAGSIVAASANQLASSRRRRLLMQYRERCGQLAELLSEAEALARLPLPLPFTHPHQDQHQQLKHGGLGMRPAGRGQSSSSSHRGSDDGHLQAQDRPAGYRHCGNGSGIAAIAGGGAGTTGSSQPEAPARTTSRAPAGETGSEAWEDSSPPLLRLGLLSSNGFTAGSGGGLVEAGAVDFGIYEPDPIVVFETTEADSTGGITRRSFLSNGTGQGHTHGTSAITGTVIPQPPAPMPSSSFTSDTGSSLADDDLTSLSHLYEIPPMASPPKFDLSDLDFGNLAL